MITISEKTLYPIKELVNFSDFYNKTYASRYIDKILIINNSGEVIENPDELKKMLRLSAKIEILQSKNVEKENKYV